MTCDITFRSKFEKLIQNEKQRQIFIAVFDHFLDQSPDNALNILWRLTYDHTEALNLFGEFGITEDFISVTIILSLRNELRYQYAHLHPTFLNEVPDECKDSFIQLRDNSDVIVANVVYNRLHTRAYLRNSFGRALHLLKQSDENKHFGGIRSLGFNYREATYLKDQHLRIHNLFNEFLINFDDNDPFISEDVNDDFEFSFILGEHQEILNETIEKAYIENNMFNMLSAKNTLKFMDDFRTFVDNRNLPSLIQLSKLGFDLNEIVAKEEQIANFIKAADALNG